MNLREAAVEAIQMRPSVGGQLTDDEWELIQPYTNQPGAYETWRMTGAVDTVLQAVSELLWI